MNDTQSWYDRVDIETLIDSIEELQSVKLAAEKHGYSLANVYDRLKRHGYRVRTEKEIKVEKVEEV